MPTFSSACLCVSPETGTHESPCDSDSANATNGYSRISSTIDSTCAVCGNMSMIPAASGR
jgi:hypothetical protein